MLNDYPMERLHMNILQTLVNWIKTRLEYIDELSPKQDERRNIVDRRVSSIGYAGPERRSGKDRRTNK
jgi:hypothetical protein